MSTNPVLFKDIKPDTIILKELQSQRDELLAVKELLEALASPTLKTLDSYWKREIRDALAAIARVEGRAQ